MGRKGAKAKKAASDISTTTVKPPASKDIYRPLDAIYCVQAPREVEEHFPDFAVKKDTKSISRKPVKIYIIEKELNPELVRELEKQIDPEQDEGKGPLNYLDIRAAQVENASNPWSFLSKESRAATLNQGHGSRAVDLSHCEPSQNPVAFHLSVPEGVKRRRR